MKHKLDQMNKIWIELERPKDEAHAELIAKLANNVLCKIGVRTREFFWDSKDQNWCIGNDMGYTTLSDNGEWFNLDYLGKGSTTPKFEPAQEHYED